MRRGLREEGRRGRRRGGGRKRERGRGRGPRSAAAAPGRDRAGGRAGYDRRDGGDAREAAAPPANAAATGGPDASTVITNAAGDKKVAVTTSPTGAALNLQNDAGTGSVTQGAGGTTITGKSGKSITIPGMAR
ncbi:MAG: hypothetical protein KF819_09485 [Labilithrix sp.]|nr:hypothetical protein [Labilithrix sp.]